MNRVVIICLNGACAFLIHYSVLVYLCLTTANLKKKGTKANINLVEEPIKGLRLYYHVK